MGLILLIILSIISLLGVLFGLIEILIPKRFYHFACKHQHLRCLYKKVYQIESPFSISYHRFIGGFSIVFVSVLCLSFGLRIWEKTVPEERNLNNIISETHHSEIEYHGELLFFDIYKTETEQLENTQLDEIKRLSKDIHIGFYKLVTNYPQQHHDGGLNFTYEYDPPKYVAVLLKDENDEEIGKIKMFSKEEAYYVNQSNQCTSLKGDFEELYSYLSGLKTKSD